MVDIIGDAAVELGEVVCCLDMSEPEPEQALHHVQNILKHLANVRHYANCLGEFMAKTTLVAEDRDGTEHTLRVADGRLRDVPVCSTDQRKQSAKFALKLAERAQSGRQVAASLEPGSQPVPFREVNRQFADRVNAAVGSLTAALEAGDLAAARVARDDLARARIELDVAAAMAS